MVQVYNYLANDDDNFNDIPLLKKYCQSKDNENCSKYNCNKSYINHKNKGIIFGWPRRKKYYLQRKRTLFVWFFSQCFYCLYILNLWPCGTGKYLNLEFNNGTKPMYIYSSFFK